MFELNDRRYWEFKLWPRVSYHVHYAALPIPWYMPQLPETVTREGKNVNVLGNKIGGVSIAEKHISGTVDERGIG